MRENTPSPDELRRLPEKVVSCSTERRPFALHSMISSYGLSRVTSSYSFPGLARGSRPFAVIQHTLGGEGALQYGERDYRLTPGTTMVVKIPHNHRYFIPSHSKEWHFYYICLSGSEVLRCLDQVLDNFGPVLELGFDSPLHSPFLTLYRGGFDQPETSSWRRTMTLSSMAYSLAVDLYAKAHSVHGASPVNKEPPWLAKALAIMGKSYEDNLSVSEIADLCSISRSYFSREFKRFRNISPRQYLETLKLSKARQLLLKRSVESRDLTIGEVAESCGFTSENYFCRIFRLNYGISPGKFRERHI
jgi:AraC family transcriptional regulator